MWLCLAAARRCCKLWDRIAVLQGGVHDTIITRTALASVALSCSGPAIILVSFRILGLDWSTVSRDVQALDSQHPIAWDAKARTARVCSLC